MLIWREDYYVKDGPAFVGIHRSGSYMGRLSDHAVAKIVKHYVTEAGLDPKKFSGHSMRAGFVTSAAKGGAEERDIMRQTGHRSVVTVRKYIREGKLFEKHPLVDTGL
jgi:integrase